MPSFFLQVSYQAVDVISVVVDVDVREGDVGGVSLLFPALPEPHHLLLLITRANNPMNENTLH